MKNKLTYVAMFVTTVLCAGAACLYFEKRFERVANEEMASVEETLLNLINKYHTTNTEEGSEILNEE